jgi:hypothetical protein
LWLRLRRWAASEEITNQIDDISHVNYPVAVVVSGLFKVRR